MDRKKKKMEFKKIDILELLPQQPPFVMVDTLLSCDRETTKTAFTVREDNIFCDNGVLSESGVIENIAQACAARMGYINKYVSNDSVKIGFIGSIKDLVFSELPKIGDKLITSIEIVSEVFAITLVNAKVEIAGKLIASCEMKISITDMNVH